MSRAERERATLPTLQDRWIGAGLALLSLALRLYGLGAQCLWYDEAQTLAVAQLPWGEIVQRAYRPPLYHFLLHLWSSLAPNSEFWLRLPSALVGVVVAPLLYAIARRVYGRGAGWAAGLLAAISPTLIAYAQELRMYSLMAAEFALLLYLLERLLRGEDRPWLWAATWLVIVASLYTHYFAIPFVLCIAGLTALTLALQRRWRDLWRWLAAQAAALLAFVPWILVILAGRGGTEDYIVAEVLPVLPEVSGVRAFVGQAWLFYATGPVTSEMALVRGLAIGAGAALGAVVCLLIWDVATSLWRWRRTRAPLDAACVADAWLLALTLLPGAAAALLYHLRPGVVHPRHLMMVAAPLLLLVARGAGWGLTLVRTGQRATWGGRIRGGVGGAAALLLTALFALSYSQALRDPTLQRADVRGMAQQVAERATPETVVLLPHRDYAFEYYFQDEAPLYHVETRVGDEDLLPWLLPRMQGAERAILIEWVHMHQDPRDLLPWFLQRNGRLVERFWSAERWISVYDLAPTLANPMLAPTEVRAGPLTLTGLALPETPPADQPLAVGLAWRLEEATSRDWKVSVRLVDGAGHVVAHDDRVLLAETATAATSRWRAGAQARNYYLLALPVGLPPVEYAVQISVYDGDGVLAFTAPDGGILGTVITVGEVTLSRPATFPGDYSPDVPMQRVELEAAPGLWLVGYGLERDTVRAGESLGIILYWRAQQGDLPAYEPRLAVQAASGAEVGSQRGHAAQGRYPMDRWEAGELVADRRLIRVQPEAEAGPAQILLRVAGESIPLGGIEIEATDRLYELPPIPHEVDVALGGLARLAGVGLGPARVQAGGPLTVTLYWEALQGSQAGENYIVFVHLIGEAGQIVAQHDGAPAEGQWPTESWAPGQVIVDPHPLQFHDPAYRGAATLAVGLYDPVTLQRLATPEGRDLVTLPITVTVE